MKLLVLTGFLGAGKTTTMNRVLGAANRRRLAVIVNDLGQINIDKQLLRATAGDMVELAGGCVCCSLDVNRDLWETLPDIIGRSSPDMVILETTGAAEPGPIVAGARERGFQPRVACVVDASSPSAMGTYAEAGAQIAGADGLLLTKLDVARPEEALESHRRLDALEAPAPRVTFPSGAEAALVRWLCDDLRPVPKRPAAPSKKTQPAAVSIIADQAFLGEPLLRVMDRLGDRIVRAKGFVQLAGDDRRAWLEKASGRVSLLPGAMAPGRTELVLIGSGLDEAEIQRLIWACAAGAAAQ